MAAVKPEWVVSIVMSASQIVVVPAGTAATAEEAAEWAQTNSGVSLCCQCSDHLDLGDPRGVIVSRDGNEVLDTTRGDE